MVGIVIDLTMIDLVSSSLSLGTWNKDKKDKKEKKKNMTTTKETTKNMTTAKSTTKNYPKKSKTNQKNYIFFKPFFSSVFCLYNF